MIDYLISTENINLTFGNKLEKLKLLFVSGSWGSLNALGKFILEAYKKREHNIRQQLRRSYRKDNNDFHF